MIRDLREIMGLTVEQVADELALSTEQVVQAEETDDKEYCEQFIHAFPIRRAVLRYPDADPFLPSYDQTFPGRRLEAWMLEYNISASEMAGILGIEVEQILKILGSQDVTVNRKQGETIEKLTGINRKWLMYGDGRNKGMPVAALRKEKEVEEDKSTLFEKMAADFEKLPDRKIKTPEEEKRERKELGLKVREARKDARLTIREAADILHVSASRVGQLECGIITEKRAEEVLKKLEEYKSYVYASKNSATAKSERAIAAVSPSGIIWGEKLKKARKSAGLSQQDVGDMISMSHASISLMEKGRVTQQTVEKLLQLISESDKQKTKKESVRKK